MTYNEQHNKLETVLAPDLPEADMDACSWPEIASFLYLGNLRQF